MSADDDTKWACKLCTFKNWSSAQKCTMCYTKRSPSVEDIYRIREEQAAQVDSCRENPTETDSWQCLFCTYVNHGDDLRCLGCSTSRKKPKTTNIDLDRIYDNRKMSKSNSHMGFPKAERVNLIKSTSQNIMEAALYHKMNSPEKASRLNLNNELDSKNRIIKNVDNTIEESPKWTCVHCTYENWPKAQKCVMCTLGRNPNSAGRSSPEATTTDSNHRRTPHRHSPPPISNNSSPNNRTISRSNRLSAADRRWLDACRGVVDGDPRPVEVYLTSGGDPARGLTPPEVAFLGRESAFDCGHTLVHLAIRFHREDMLAMLLSRIEGDGYTGIKRVPSYVAPDLAADIRRHVSATLRPRKGSFPCYFVTEVTTFSLPAEVEDLTAPVQNQLFDELLDKEAQNELESDPPVLNWSLEITERLGSRLYALWNRSAGDCLLDSVMQATWGVFDRENVLRRALAESLHKGGHLFYPRWRDYESSQASLLHFTLDETQYEEDWAGLLSLANQPGASLDQLHVFALSHILRRPIIVYGVKYVKSFRGEALGLARFEGVYLPILWEPSFCVRSPLALGYTRGHFSALVPIEPYTTMDLNSDIDEAKKIDNKDHLQVIFLPLMDRDRKLLPIHFLTEDEAGKEEAILKEWLDVCFTESGIMVAQQKLMKRPLLVAQMLEEWLNHYRRLDQMNSAPYNSTKPVSTQNVEFSSDGESEDE